MSPSSETDQSTGPGWIAAGFALAYVVLVLAADTLAVQGVDVPFRWSVLHRDVEVTVLESITGEAPAREWAYFDFFKFTAWFLIPFAICLYRIDLGYFSVRRWKRSDIVILVVLMVLGIGAVALIPYLPGVKDLYRGYAEQSAEFKWSYARGNLLWTFSWLIGWEFMLRYYLLRNAVSGFGRHAWLLVPLVELVYHFQKPPLEALLSGAGGVVLTYWALQRKNVLLPFLAHLSIELALLVFMLVT